MGGFPEGKGARVSYRITRTRNDFLSEAHIRTNIESFLPEPDDAQITVHETAGSPLTAADMYGLLESIKKAGSVKPPRKEPRRCIFCRPPDSSPNNTLPHCFGNPDEPKAAMDN